MMLRVYILLCSIGMLFHVKGEDSICAVADSLAGIPFPFLHREANRIIYNGADWSELREKFRNSGSEPFSILHIGDSHIQPDIATGVVRRKMQAEFGDAGRGLVIPYKLASTNEPRDYRMTLDCNGQGTRLLKTPWTLPMAMTGISVSPYSRNYKLKIEDLRENGEPFRFIRLYFTGDIEIETVETSTGWINYTLDVDEEDGYYDVFIPHAQKEITLGVRSSRGAVFHGALLGSEKPGIFYHTIGNNGATFEIYNRLNGFGNGVATLYPDLVILSMGTNEAYNRLSPEEFKSHVSTLIDDITNQNPDVRILLTTPKECQRRVKGRRRNSKGAYTRVEECRTIRDAIMEFAAQRKIALYDWFEIAGGEGASDNWVRDGLLSNDRVHNTNQGYELSGDIFFDALREALVSDEN